MPTKYPDLFTSLARPFDPPEVKSFSKGGKSFHYVTGRTVQNRLDEACGPENWRDEFVETRDGLKCLLSIRVDGDWITKEDGGASAGMSDHDDDEKSAYSSAFKRAAVKWGVGRYLYRDGVADFREPAALNGHRAPAEPARPAATKPAGKAADAKSRAAEDAERVRLWEAFAKHTVGEAVGEWRAEMAREGVHKDRRPELANAYSLTNELCSRAIAKDPSRAAEVMKPGKLKVKDPARVRAFVARIYAKHPEAVEQVAREYLAAKRSDLRAKLGLPDVEAEVLEVGSNGDVSVAEILVDEPGMNG